MSKPLVALHGRLLEAQRDLIQHAVLANTLPTEGVIQKIAALENTIAAIEHMLEDAESLPSAAPDADASP